MGRLTARPRLLFLCQTLPYPPDGGVWIRTYHVLRLLAQAFDITALCFERTTTFNGVAPDVAAGCAALRPFASVEVFPIPQRHSRTRYMWDHVRSTALRRVYTTYLYNSRAFRRRLRDLVRSGEFELVHVDSMDLATHVPACRDIPVICVHHDVNSALLRRRAAVERSRWRNRYLRYQARLMEAVERRWCERVALNVAVSEQDRSSLKQLAPASRVAIVPNGVDVEEFYPDGTNGTGVAYVGGTHWFPNLDALQFFCGEIWPHLRALRADVTARWIGSATPDERRQYRDLHGVELTGYVEDVRPFMRDAACHIVPLRAGGGTRLKILNSWAMGKAVVSTSIGCEGLAAVDGENILIRDNPIDFANAVVSVLENSRMRRHLAERGRETVERLYSWDLVGRGMIETYLNAARIGTRIPAPARVAAGAEPRYDHR